MQLEFDSTTQMLRVMGDDASFPVMIQRWGLSWLRGDEAVLLPDWVDNHEQEWDGTMQLWIQYALPVHICPYTSVTLSYQWPNLQLPRRWFWLWQRQWFVYNQDNQFWDYVWNGHWTNRCVFSPWIVWVDPLQFLDVLFQILVCLDCCYAVMLLRSGADISDVSQLFCNMQKNIDHLNHSESFHVIYI